MFELIERGAFEPNLERVRGLLRLRRDAMLESLERELPEGVTWSRPEGGYFLWVELGESVDAADLLARAVEAGVAFVKGSDFFPGASGGAHAARLAFSYETPERIREGVAVLGSLLEGLTGADLCFEPRRARTSRETKPITKPITSASTMTRKSGAFVSKKTKLMFVSSRLKRASTIPATRSATSRMRLNVHGLAASLAAGLATCFGGGVAPVGSSAIGGDLRPFSPGVAPRRAAASRAGGAAGAGAAARSPS